MQDNPELASICFWYFQLLEIIEKNKLVEFKNNDIPKHDERETNLKNIKYQLHMLLYTSEEDIKKDINDLIKNIFQYWKDVNLYTCIQQVTLKSSKDFLKWMNDRLMIIKCEINLDLAELNAGGIEYKRKANLHLNNKKNTYGNEEG